MENSETKQEVENNNNKENPEEIKSDQTEDANENFIKAESTSGSEKVQESKGNGKLNLELDANANVEQVINLDSNIIPDTQVTDLDDIELIGKNDEIEITTSNQEVTEKNLQEKLVPIGGITSEENIDLKKGERTNKEDGIYKNLEEKLVDEIIAEHKQENIDLESNLRGTDSVKFREKKEKSKNKEKRVTFLEQNVDEENDFNVQSAKSNESKVVWEIVSETKSDDPVTEVKNERKKSEKLADEYRSNVSSTEAKDMWKEYKEVATEEMNDNSRDNSVFMNFLQERQREKTISISDFNDFPTMSPTGVSSAQALPTQCNHMCGSLFGSCGSVKQEALVQTFSQARIQEKKYENDSYTGPVSLTEILQEREHSLKASYDTAWSVVGSKERMCKSQELDEDLQTLERRLMGNGASSSNPLRNNEVKNGYGLCNKTSGVLDPDSANSDTYEYVKTGVLGLMQRETKEWENKAVDLNNEVISLQKDVKRKEQEILRLQREVHKLKSVLQQATSFSKDGDLLSTLQEVHGMAGQKVGTNNKKQGVSAESSQPNKTATDIHVKRYEKDFRSKQLIKAAIMDNDFLKNLDLSQVRELVESMYPKECIKGGYVIREGEAGAHLYVAAEGEFEVIKEHKVLGRIGPGKAFGELAILYNCTRTASIRVIKDSKVWVLDRRVFQRIMMQTGLQRLEDNINFLRSVPLLKNLSDDVLAKISDVLEVEFYPSGHHIIRQGANGDTFFILSQGSVKVTQRLQGSTEEQEIRILERGDYFGEQALLKEDCRTASVIALPPGVECLALDRESFIQLIGDLSEFQEKDYGDRTRISIDRPPSSSSIHSEPDQELAHIRLDDLDVLATLGVGGFGRVELVQCLYDKSQTFALKCMKKQHIVETHQQEHVYSEKSIMMSCRHPFICRLYRTFKDTKYVYMLMEACLGGEVWTILRDRGCFDDATCCFITACVIEALHYLHSRGIVFRDLKPENLLLDSQGYVKLVDFGFAKRLGVSSGKTWTFCGTPEYVAPEVILNKGHDRAVDCWALGILIHELLTGAPPFSGSDPMKVYNMILKGIDMVDFPRHVTRTAQALIKKLCRDSPAERLGCQKGGLADIKKNKWFQGFDWDGLRQRTLIPPIVPQIRNPTDTANFDQYPKEMHIPEDETSNWDADF